LAQALGLKFMSGLVTKRGLSYFKCYASASKLAMLLE